MTASTHSSRRAGTIGAGLLTALLLASALSASPQPAPAPLPIRAGAPTAAYAWSPARVRELIALIQEASNLGLDPDDYGLAALRSELELAEELWNTPGSRQLDSLARAAAIALAADCRGIDRGGPAASLGGSLDQALARGTLRSWLYETRVPVRTGPVRKGTL